MPTLVYDHPELADALARLSKFPLTQSEGRPPSVRTQDVFGHPPAPLFVSLNRKTTANRIAPVDLDQLEPTQEFIPLGGLTAYILKPRPDTPDVVHVTMFDGRERWVIQEGHTRLGAAVLLGAGSFLARVWNFAQAADGTFEPVPRGRHRHGMKRSQSLHEDWEDDSVSVNIELPDPHAFQLAIERAIANVLDLHSEPGRPGYEELHPGSEGGGSESKGSERKGGAERNVPEPQQRFEKRWPYDKEMDAFAAKYGRNRLDGDLKSFWENQERRGVSVPSYEFQIEVVQRGAKRLSKERREAKKVQKNAAKPKLLEQMQKKYGYTEGDVVFDSETGARGVVKWGADGQPYVKSNEGKHYVGARWKKSEKDLTYRERLALVLHSEPGRPGYEDLHPGGEGGGSSSERQGFGGLLNQIKQPDGGFTVHAVTREQPTTGFALSIFKGREKVLPVKEMTLGDLARFVQKNSDILTQTDNYLGAWHNPKDGKVYLDVSKVVTSEAEAERLGRANGQLAYFDLEHGHAVDIQKEAA